MVLLLSGPAVPILLLCVGGELLGLSLGFGLVPLGPERYTR
jgi:hypothetical protein